MTRTNCGQCMGANPAGARAETGALSRECHLSVGCARSSAAQCFAAICSAAWPAAVALERHSQPPSVRRSCLPRRKGARGLRRQFRFALWTRSRRAPERPLSGGAVRRARRERGQRRFALRTCFLNAFCPAELFATLDGSAGDAAVCVRGAPPDRSLSGGAVCRARRARGRRRFALPAFQSSRRC